MLTSSRMPSEDSQGPVSVSAPLDNQGNLHILGRYQNFFVLATSSSNPRAEASHVEPTSNSQTWHIFTHEIDVKAAFPENRIPRGLKIIPFYIQRRTKILRTILEITWVANWLEVTLVITGLLVSFVAHAVNMFNYPHYEQDEGTYMMYAWAVTHGRIDPYPYGYGHPPLAWMMIAAWTKLTGGFFAFGDAINSGRVLVLLLTVGSTLLVYLIARSLGGGLIASLFAMAIFSLSPLSITFQREVLLDNFATFWFLLALYLLVMGKSHLLRTISAALCFGFALLSKEVLIVLIPAMIYVAWFYTARFQRTFGLVAFIYTVIAVGSTFILMALLKDELFPYSWHLPWDHHPHLSLIDTFAQQAQRGQSGGSIRDSWNAWVKGDPLLIAFGVATPLFNLIVGWRSRKHLCLSLLAISFWALLVRGGVVFAFYIIPLIPLIALNAVFALNTIVHWIGRVVRFETVGKVLILCSLVALIPYDIQHSLSPNNLFTLRPAQVETEALTWIRANVPRRAMLVINSNLFTDLHEQEGDGVGNGAVYPYAHVYWFVALDPGLHDTLLKGNWDRIDYIIADLPMIHDIETYGGGMNLINTALEHSVLRAEFKGDQFEDIQIYQVIHIIPPPEI